MKYPKVSIIILNWNGLKDTVECLESIRKLDYLTYDIIVIDNGSTDECADVIKQQFPEVILLRNENNMGFAGGNNVGIKYALEAGADYVWLLNNDTIVKSDSLSRLVDFAGREAQIGMVSPVIYYYHDQKKIQFDGGYFDWDNFVVRELSSNVEAHGSQNKNITLWGTALLIKRSVINSIGLLNEKYFAYWEDAEYCNRALKSKYINKIVVSATVFHKYHISTSKNVVFPYHFYFYMTRNEYFFWTESSRGLKKIKFIRKYLINILREIDHFNKNIRSQNAGPMLDGVYCGFVNIGGPWTRNAHMPIFIKNALIGHPYFFMKILEGKIGSIILEIMKRVFASLNVTPKSGAV